MEPLELLTKIPQLEEMLKLRRNIEIDEITKNYLISLVLLVLCLIILTIWEAFVFMIVRNVDEYLCFMSSVATQE